MILVLSLLACRGSEVEEADTDLPIASTCPDEAVLDALEAPFAAALTGSGVGGGALIVFTSTGTCSVTLAGTRDGLTPMSEDAAFALPQVGGLPMAIVASQLAAEGELDATARIGDLLPQAGFTGSYGDERGYGDFSDEITVARLARHRAGLGETLLTSCGADTLTDAVDDAVSNVIVPPGADYYVPSHKDYGYLAAAVELSTGSPWEEVVQQRVFDAAGLDSATYDPGRVDVAAIGDYTNPYDDALHVPVGPDDWEGCPLVTPATGLWATPADVGKLGTALLDGTFDLDALRAGATDTGRPLPGHDTFRYGSGVFEVDHAGQVLVGERGVYQGYGATLLVAPDADLGVAMLVRSDAYDGFADAAALLDAAAGLSHTPVQVPVADLTALSGNYYDPYYFGSASITEADGLLVLTAWDLNGEATLRPLGGGAFAADFPYPYEVYFAPPDAPEHLFYAVAGLTRVPE